MNRSSIFIDRKRVDTYLNRARSALQANSTLSKPLPPSEEFVGCDDYERLIWTAYGDFLETHHSHYGAGSNMTIETLRESLSVDWTIPAKANEVLGYINEQFMSIPPVTDGPFNRIIDSSPNENGTDDLSVRVRPLSRKAAVVYVEI